MTRSHKLSSKMADAVKDCTVVTDSLAQIPDNISVSQLSDAKNISGRSLERGLNYYTQCYIHDVRITPGANDEKSSLREAGVL